MPPTELALKNPESLIPEPPTPKPGEDRRVLTGDEKNHILNFIAQGYTDQQILALCKQRFDLTLRYQNIFYYRHSEKWAHLRKTLRNYYSSRIDLVEGSRKDARARRLELIQDRALDEGNLKAALQANEQLRREFTEEPGGVNIYMNNPQFAQFNSLSNEELESRYRAALQKLSQIKQGDNNGSSGTASKDTG